MDNNLLQNKSTVFSSLRKIQLPPLFDQYFSDVKGKGWTLWSDKQQKYQCDKTGHPGKS